MTLLPERPGHPASADIAGRRDGMTKALAQGIWATDPTPALTMAGGVQALVWEGGKPLRARVIHFHGGGYRMGCPEMEGPFSLALAQACSAQIIAPRYRLAPEAPFPAALNDAQSVLAATPDDLPLFLSGGSAGGGLAAALALLARTAGRRIAGIMLHSPWLDLSVSAGSYLTNAASDPLFSREAAELAARLYLQGHDASDQLASPIGADLAGLAPCLISVGSGEVLLDDSRVFAARLKSAGVPVHLLQIDGMDHVAVSRALTAAGAAEVLAAAIAFILEHRGQEADNGT